MSLCALTEPAIALLDSVADDVALTGRLLALVVDCCLYKTALGFPCFWEKFSLLVFLWPFNFDLMEELTIGTFISSKLRVLFIDSTSLGLLFAVAAGSSCCSVGVILWPALTISLLALYSTLALSCSQQFVSS